MQANDIVHTVQLYESLYLCSSSSFQCFQLVSGSNAYFIFFILFNNYLTSIFTQTLFDTTVIALVNYFLIPSSNENNLIYLQNSEWGKHDKKQQISSSGVVLSFVFQQDFLFLHHLTSETNNKALIQRTSQYFDMTHVIAALSYFPVTLS